MKSLAMYVLILAPFISTRYWAGVTQAQDAEN